MNIVIPMAGRGARFAQAGFTVPKPLIDVRGEPMYAWAVRSLPLKLARRLIFVCLREHLEDRRLADDIRTRFGWYKPQIVALDAVTEGQACTVLAAHDHLDLAQPLLVYNADTYERNTLAATLPTLDPSVAGVLSVFRAPGDKWSFARVDADDHVVETSEKRRISEWASTGLYWFRTAGEYAAYVDKMMAAGARVNGEYYIAPMYNLMIADGLEVRVHRADEVWVLGTPEDLARFQAEHP